MKKRHSPPALKGCNSLAAKRKPMKFPGPQSHGVCLFHQVTAQRSRKLTLAHPLILDPQPTKTKTDVCVCFLKKKLVRKEKTYICTYIDID